MTGRLVAVAPLRTLVPTWIVGGRDAMLGMPSRLRTARPEIDVAALVQLDALIRHALDDLAATDATVSVGATSPAPASPASRPRAPRAPRRQRAAPDDAA
jgi:hypothetical protein